MTAAAALARAAARIARLDAEVLLAHQLGLSRAELLLRARDLPVDEAAFAALVGRRAAGEPVAYVTGEREFWSLPFRVTPDVLIPRPDSETLVAQALRHLTLDRPGRVLDLGTGSGCLLLALLSERPLLWGLGVDRSPAAARIAAGNAAALGLADRAAFAVGDWAAALTGRFDCILANPPYVGAAEETGAGVASHEPHAALFAGVDGLDACRALVPQLPRLMAPDCHAHVEIGWQQADAVAALAAENGLESALTCDIEGRPRCLTLSRRNKIALGSALDCR